MNLLVVHEVNYLSKIIYEFQILPEILSLLGHTVQIVDYDDTWKKDSNSGLSNRSRIHRNVHRAYENAAVTVRRPGMVRLPYLSRVSLAITSPIAVLKALRETRPDVVILYGLPTIGLQTLALARYFGVPVIFRCIDVIHQLVPNRLLATPTKILERLIFNRVDLCIALTPHLRTSILKYGVPEERIRLLPSGVDATMFCPGPRDSEMLSKWGLEPHHQVILFMGTIYSFSGLDRVIADFPRLLNRHPNARLLVLGFGEDEARLRALTYEKGLERQVVFTGMQPYGDLCAYIRSAHICINPFELNGVTRDILPTKLFQYMACRKPVLATELPGMLPFLAGEEHGIVYTELPSFVDCIADLLDKPDYCEALGRRGEDLARNKYDWTQIAMSLMKMVQEVIE